MEQKKLFTPIKLGNCEIKNRVVMPSMCVHFCDADGHVTDVMLEYVRRRAAGGAGLLIIPGSSHGKRGKGRPALSEDSDIPDWKLLADTVHQYGAKLFCQIHPAKHQAGRGEKVELPVDFAEEDIEDLIGKYAACAARAQKAGVDGVDIHGAHAHEIALFLSALYNERTDQYGGSIEKRAEFPVRIVKAIKQACGVGFPVVFRISGTEAVEGGRTIEESVEIAKLLEKAGADAIHVSIGMPKSGGYISAPMDVDDCFNVENAATIRRAVNIPVIAVNRIVDIEQAVNIVESGKADMISMARSHLADPELVNKYLGINKEPVCRCVGCNQGCKDSKVRKTIICMQNPFLGFETQRLLTPFPEDAKLKKVVIVGAGPAGLEMALDLARRGLSPEIYEKSSVAGGLVRLSAGVPRKGNMKSIIDCRLKSLENYGVPIHYNTEMTPELLKELKPDVAVIATGSRPVVPPIPGIDGSRVFICDDVLNGAQVPGGKVALLGGGLIGCETADYLATQGKEVTIIDVIPELATTLNSARRHFMLKRMSSLPISYKLERRVERIALPEVVISSPDGEETLTGFDALVVAAGRRSVNSLAEIAKAIPGTQVIVIGDASGTGLALDAIQQAAQAACDLTL
ncbi:MAG TPA: NAD(P)/FAD-dependent oxidoreductase [Anaerovoracaceae bacterium]|nr:NAD(P)/FAD-dependent oxidoreductase [Anaerovoracaceae bacterium]